MSVDWYTKGVLTVIAVCLAFLVSFRMGGPTVSAVVEAQGNNTVILAGWSDANGKVWKFPAPVYSGAAKANVSADLPVSR
jgi:hypothetical protein